MNIAKIHLGKKRCCKCRKQFPKEEIIGNKRGHFCKTCHKKEFMQKPSQGPFFSNKPRSRMYIDEFYELKK